MKRYSYSIIFIIFDYRSKLEKIKNKYNVRFHACILLRPAAQSEQNVSNHKAQKARVRFGRRVKYCPSIFLGWRIVIGIFSCSVSSIMHLCEA